MTHNTQSDTYTAPLSELSAGDALQRLYSYTESTGPDVGDVIDALTDTPPGTNCDGLVEKVQDNSDAFQAPADDSDQHFTDIVGDAREAADNGDTEIALDLLDRVIIPHLKDTAAVFTTVEAGAIEHHAVSEETISHIRSVTRTYGYMVKMAEHAKTQLR